MKRWLSLLLLLAAPAWAQSPDAMKYGPRPILLLDANPGVEAVMPMAISADGQTHLEFIPASKIKESIDKGGRPVTLADVISLLGAANQKVSELQAENDKLWKVALKDAPKPATIVVQQPAPTLGLSQPEIAAQQQAAINAQRQQALQIWMAMQNGNRPQTLNLNVTNCTRLPALCVR